MAMSDYLEGKLIKVAYNGVAFTPPTTWEVRLYNTDPTDADSGTELSLGGYAPTLFTPTTAVTPEWIVSNNADIVFPTATADWATINFVAVFDNLGNMLDYGAITTPRTVLTDGVFKILLGELDIQYT